MYICEMQKHQSGARAQLSAPSPPPSARNYAGKAVFRIIIEGGWLCGLIYFHHISLSLFPSHASISRWDGFGNPFSLSDFIKGNPEFDQLGHVTVNRVDFN